jgi:hypothetical protein
VDSDVRFQLAWPCVKGADALARYITLTSLMLCAQPSSIVLRQSLQKLGRRGGAVRWTGCS